MKIPIKKKKFGDPPYPPKKADFGRTKAKMGRFSQNNFCYSFEILQGLLSKKKQAGAELCQAQFKLGLV